MNPVYTRYTIEGVAGAGYRVGMIWDGREGNWRTRDGTDGREAVGTREEAARELADALAAGDGIEGIEIVASTYDLED